MASRHAFRQKPQKDQLPIAGAISSLQPESARKTLLRSIGSAWKSVIGLLAVFGSLYLFWPKPTIIWEETNGRFDRDTLITLKNESTLLPFTHGKVLLGVDRITFPVGRSIETLGFLPDSHKYDFDEVPANEERSIRFEDVINNTIIIDTPITTADITVLYKYKYLWVLPLHTERRFVAERMSDGHLTLMPRKAR